MKPIQADGLTAFQSVLRSLPVHDQSTFHDYVDAVFSASSSSSPQSLDRTYLLASLPLPGESSASPMRVLSALLTDLKGPWPTFDLICCYARVWKHLPEDAKAGSDTTHAGIIAHLDKQVKASYSDLSSLLPTTRTSAIKDATSKATLSHSDLANFVRSFRFPAGVCKSTHPVVAVALPNGPLLAIALLAVTTYCTAAPMSTSSGQEQFKSDILQSQASILIATTGDVTRLGLDQEWVEQAGIIVVLAESNVDMTFSMTALESSLSGHASSDVALKANEQTDAALLLFTSGTSGTKKSVPITVHTIVSGVAFVIESWGLKSHDTCLNMMPLFHVGGIVRNLFAPIMAGGSTVCCMAFDPNLFWDVMEDHQPTWYYASPSMHSVILDEAPNRPEALEKSRMRLICNAAGGLLPSLACNLRDTFGCCVLPSYGMTECMPISSPPLSYQLDRPGTSGISVGPEIGILDGNDRPLPAGELGRIAVRGAPIFGGYLKVDGIIDKSAFTAAGWFDTGDMGHLDMDGFLYITGRSKEVINRGGELISPFEVEEAVLSAAQRKGSPLFERVTAVLAFSMPHDVLQEVVGIVLVTPQGANRPDLKCVQDAVKDSLNSVKWPSYVVYMDDLPKNNNKVMRIRMAERLGLKEISDDVLIADRHYEAVCPAANSALSVRIKGNTCKPDLDMVSRKIRQAIGSESDVFVRPANTDGYTEAFIAPKPTIDLKTYHTAGTDLFSVLWGSVHDYNIPGSIHFFEEPFPVENNSAIDAAKLDLQIKKDANETTENLDMSSTEETVARSFSKVLHCSIAEMRRDSDFFKMGGDSLRAGRLLSELRNEFKVRLPINLLFSSSQINDLANQLDEMKSRTDPVDVNTQSGVTGPTASQATLPIISKTCSSTNPFLLVLQLTPIMVLYPMKRALVWTIFLYMMSITQYWPTNPYLAGRLFNLIVCLGVGRAATSIIAPFFGMLMKWLIIGKYKSGLYPMWSRYHTRWWIVQKILAICGRGFFGYTDTTLIWYYRMLGANIGKNVKIDPAAILGEYDLLHIEDGANLDKCICRGFAVEQNTTMYLGRVHLGKNTSVGLHATIAPGTILANDACIGPNSSSWEAQDADEANRDLSSGRIPGTHFLLELLIIVPISGVVAFLRAGPWMAGLIGVVRHEPSHNYDEVRAIIDWFAEPHRLAFHYFALIMHVYLGPFAWFIVIYFIKKCLDGLFGKMQSSPAQGRSQGQRFRMALIKKVIPTNMFHKVVETFGSHYEPTSFFYRALGAKIGKRVYWPGTGPSVQDIDLLDIGDNVVFGSRSHIVTSDGYGSNTVKVEDGAMIADRVVLLPGVTVGAHTVLGSGAITRRNKHYEADSVWVGSKAGDAVCLSKNNRRTAVTPEDDLTRRLNQRLSKIETTVTEKPSFFTRMSSTTSTLVSPTRNASRAASIHRPAPPRLFSNTSSILTAVASPFSRKGSSPSSKEASVNVTAIATPPHGAIHVRQNPVATTSPFGRAFYDHEAPYRVWSLGTIFIYSTLTITVTAFYWNLAPTCSIQLLHLLFSSDLLASYLDVNSLKRPLIIYAFFTLFLSALITIQTIIALAVVVAAKWILLGRRTQGNYNWDSSSYCQRWQLFLSIEKLRRNCFGGNGILSLLTGTHYIVLYFRALGATIGKDCALFAGGKPSCLLTEPDLVTLGDRVAVDDASLVCHINSRGVFDLNPLKVGDRSVLRSGTRLLSGASMGADACLLEHTLVMAGDVVDDGVTMQGWPADQFETAKRLGVVNGERVVGVRFD